jgi:hypothetical protein
MGRVTNRGKNIWILVEKGQNPFTIPLSEFVGLSFSDYKMMAKRAYKLCKDEIEKAFKANKDVYHIIICDGEIVYSSKNVAGIDSRIIEEIMRRKSKPCYTFSREDLVEEVPWTKLDGDYYPTLEVFIGGKEWINEEVVRLGKRIVSDFDTGNPFYTIFDEKDGKKIVAPPKVYEFHLGHHFGLPYWYFMREVRLCIKDSLGKLRGKNLEVRFVRDWRRSPLLLPNSKREGFVGRNLLFDFNLKVILDPFRFVSIVELLEYS